MMLALLCHLAQSSVFALVVLVLTLALKHRAAAMRHRLWIAAGLKFAIPFSWFGALGAALGEHLSVVPKPFHSLYGTVLLDVSGQAIPVQRAIWIPALCLLCWIGGSTVLLIKWLRQFRSSVWETAPASSIEEEALRRCVRKMELGTMPRLRVASHSQEPCVRGVLRPLVLVPRGFCDRLGLLTFDAVLLHELAHVKRKDNLWAVVIHAIGCVFWFYPVLFWIERRMREEAELACDALVLQAGAQRDAYLSGLVEVCRMSLLEPVAGSSPIGGKNLQKRLEKIMTYRIEGRGSRVLGRLGGALLAGGCGLAFVLGIVGSHSESAQAAARSGDVATAVHECEAGQPEPFAVGTVIRHMPRQQMQVCVLAGKRPTWLTLAKGDVPNDVKVIDIQDPPPTFCKETAPQGKLCTCDDAAFSPGAIVTSPRGKLACPATGGRWQLYKAVKGPWPPASLTE